MTQVKATRLEVGFNREHCTADLPFILFAFSCFAYAGCRTVLLVRLNPNQSRRRSAVQWYFPLWRVLSGFNIYFNKTMHCMTHQQQSPSAVFMRWPTFECGNNRICLEHKSEGINQGPRKKIFRFEWKRETHDWASQIEKKKKNWIIKYGNIKSTV